MSKAWDLTLKRAESAFKQRHVGPTNDTSRCARYSQIDQQYLADLAASKFVLAPAGDHPWSLRFFEAVVSGAIPVVDDSLHTGRNPTERQLGYRFLLRSELEGDQKPPEYCPEWAQQNLEIFLKHQAWDGAEAEVS